MFCFVQTMEGRKWLKVVILMSSIVLCGARAELRVKHKDHLSNYNHTLATILVEYASAVYLSDMTELFTWTCSRCDGLTKGFEVIELIVDVQHCLQGFVGVAKDLNAIVIAFRGTQERSLQNWIEDLYWKQLDLNYPGMPNAMVHHGFYSSYHNTTIRPGIVNAVKQAKEMYGEINVMVTGHSMGGAMAAFCGLDLMVNIEAKNVHVVTFGQPRIGNAAFASYYSQLVPNTVRVTNDHDIVPHLPPYYSHFAQKTYHHFPREVWLYKIGFGSLVYRAEKVCDGSGEDPSCSRSVRGNSISDHLEYYGVKLGGESTGTCRIVTDPSFAAYSTRDIGGNFILSRDPPASFVKMKIESSNSSNFSWNLFDQ
ncbi:lipase-like isoform X3 [Diospyros lotus]|nr:lipase-like isoform X3 [Diospyros lotus]